MLTQIVDTLTRNDYHRLSHQDIPRISEKYQVSFLVIEKTFRYDLGFAYKNRDHVICRIHAID